MKWLAAGFALLLVFTGWATRPSPLEPPTVVLSLGADVAADLAASETDVDAQYGLIPGTEKRITWATEAGERTPLVVVYLHGFSATRQEIAPVPELLARALGANLFETRLTGHGRRREALAGMRAEQWLRDGEEALAVASGLGERIVLVGASTGATLAVALSQHPQFELVDSLVLLSPNFGPAAAGADLATGPFGPQLLRLLAGEERQWEPANAQQARYWSTRYPNAAVIEMMRLVDLARDLVPRTQVPTAILVYSEQDQVVSLPRLKAEFAALPATRKAVLKFSAKDTTDPSAHILAGDILAPQNTQPLVAALLDELQRR